MSLRPKSRAAEQAFHERNVRHLLELVGFYGLPAGERMNLEQQLHRRAVTTRDEHLELDDRPRVVADVWQEGLRAGQSRIREPRGPS